MALAVLYSRSLAGMEAPLVTVEACLANGLPSFTIVGLPEAEVKEAKDRVRAALQNARFEFPARRITINLTPADLPKESGRFDLPIALGILAASGQLPLERLLTNRYNLHDVNQALADLEFGRVFRIKLFAKSGRDCLLDIGVHLLTLDVLIAGDCVYNSN